MSSSGRNLAVDPALTATYATQSGSSIGLIGDSITNNNGTSNGYMFSTGYWSWANVLLGHRFDLTYIDGVPGSGCTDAGWAGRVTTMAGKKLPWCVVEIGTNDVADGQTFAAITAAITTTLDTLKTAGSRVLILTVPPRNTLTTGQWLIHGQVNTWIRQLPSTRTGVTVADVAAYLTDPAAANPATYVAAYTGDGIHPTPLGCSQMGKAIQTALSPLTPPLAGVLVPQNDASNMLSVAASQWAGGASAQPTAWTGTSASATWSQVPRTDGLPGTAQRVVVPAGGSVQIHYPVGGYVAGDRMVGFLEILNITGIDPAPAANTQQCYLYMVAYTPAFGVDNVTGDLYPNGTQPNAAPAPGIYQTPPLLASSTGLQEIDLFIEIHGGGTYDLGRVGIVKVGATY